MSGLYIAIGLTVGVLGLGAYAFWLVSRNSLARGRAEAESEARGRTIENAKARTQSDDEIKRMDPEQRRRALAEWVSGDDK